MNDLLRLNLIHLFTFYLTATFVLSTFRRLNQYHDIANLVRGMPNRWPCVLRQIKKHWVLFFTWSTFRPAILALTLMAIQIICSRLIWPRARITPGELADEWWMVPVLIVAASAMLAVDLYFIIRVGRIDRAETEKYLDEAEHWMTSWKAPFVKVLTLGYVNPRKIVDIEVRKALEEGQDLLNRNLYWMSLQAALRVLFGLCLWISWAVHPDTSV